MSLCLEVCENSKWLEGCERKETSRQYQSILGVHASLPCINDEYEDDLISTQIAVSYQPQRTWQIYVHKCEAKKV
jgi:hypothetical protein